MKRLIVFSASGFLIVLAIVLLMRLGPGVSPAHAEDPPPTPTPAEQLAQAAQLKDQKKWEDALTILRQVATRRAEDEAAAAQGQLRQGEYLLQMALPARAESELRRVLADFPSVRDAADAARLFLSDSLAFQGKNDLALQEAQNLAQDASAVLALRGWGFVRWAGLLRNAGRADEAVTVLDQLAALPWPIEDAGPKIEGGLLQARILVDREQLGPAATALEHVITSAAGDAYAQQRNWARVFLAQVSLNLAAHSRVQQVTDNIVADHAAGKANDEQVAWGLIWKARSSKQLRQYAQGLDALQMAVAVAYANHPPVAFEAQFDLGDICSAHGSDVQAAGGDWGPLHEQALAHYLAAFDMAKAKQLGEDCLDRARLQIGTEMRHMGMRERGIAWLRMGMKDPAGFTGMDRTLSERMASFMTPEEAEAWHEYLLAPAQTPDPTSAFVLKEFKTDSPSPSSVWVDSLSLRQFWLGRLYEKQKRASEARVAFEQALSVATIDRERAEALLRLAPYRRKAEGRKAGLQTAKQASDLWLRELETIASDGDAHYSIEMAFSSYDRAGFPQEAIALLEQLVASISPDLEPAQACFARYYLINKYVCYRRNVEAKALAEQTTELFRGRWFAQGHDWLCSQVLFYLAHLYAREGDLASATQSLDEVESRWPGLAASVAAHRLVLQNPN